MHALKNSKILLSVLALACFVNVSDCSGNPTNVLDISWRLPEPEGASDSSCEKDLRDMYAGLRNMTLWAVESTVCCYEKDCSYVWDSTAKGPSGLLQGSTYQLGNFGECLKDEETVIVPGPPRQYCLVRVTLHSPEQEKRHNVFVENFDPFGSANEKIFYSGDHVKSKLNVVHWGVCAPASCRPAELESLLQRHFHEQTLTWNQTGPVYQVSVSSTSCQKPREQKPFTAGAQLFFWIVGVSIGLVLLGSSYHWYLIRHAQEKEVECPPIVKAYSLIYHLRQLGKKEKPDWLGFLWGLRFLSICFIIFDHRYGIELAGPVTNKENIEELFHKSTSIFIIHGDLLVDSFFVLSGLLSSYSLLKMYTNASMNVPLLIIRRYFRLAPAYAVMLLFTAEILPLTGSGPLWPFIMEPEKEYCRQNWWTNLLMLNNYINPRKMCMIHTWYIPCDFHYFLVSLVICALFRIRSRLLPAMYVFAALLLASLLVPAFISYTLKLPAIMLFINDFLMNAREDRVFQNIYIGSHTRAGPYLLGVLTGYLIVKHHKPENKKISTTLSMIGTAVSLGVLLGVMASGIIFYEVSRPYNVLEASTYAGLHRSAWAVGLCLLILCCVFGHVPIISVILSWSPWTPLGKLVYGAYLVHMGLQIRDLALSRQPLHLEVLGIIGRVFGDLAISFSASLLLYVAAEGPIREIVDILTGKKKTKKASMTEETYSQTGYNNRALDMELEAQPVPALNKDITDNSIMQIFTKKDNTVEGNENNIKIDVSS